MSVEENFRTVEDRIAAACRRAGRDPSEVLIVVVTKTVDAAFVRDKLLPLGIRHLGENRISPAAKK
ncbi:MAG: YggS family pyridoxal phosphate enzyme, partial [Planctomycetes bacterium]|nr:YggS family pyridoxal phosphate enzyme [Planctomycetota bacterium]